MGQGFQEINRAFVGPVNKIMILVAAVAGERLREFYRVADVLKEIPPFVQ